VNALVGDLGLPTGQLRVEVLQVVEHPARREVALEYFTPDSTLPFVCARYG